MANVRGKAHTMDYIQLCETADYPYNMPKYIQLTILESIDTLCAISSISQVLPKTLKHNA